MVVFEGKVHDIANSSLSLAETKFYEVGLAPPCLSVSFAKYRALSRDPSGDRVMRHAEVWKCYRYEIP